MTEYECALSGTLADKRELIADEEDDMPVGWSRITIERRTVNPEWWEVQNVKATLIEASLMQVPEAQRPQMLPLVAMQVAAQFIALEDKLGQYVTTTEVLYIAPTESDAQLAAEYNDLRGRLGLAEIGADADDAEADDDADETDDEGEE